MKMRKCSIRNKKILREKAVLIEDKCIGKSTQKKINRCKSFKLNLKKRINMI